MEIKQFVFENPVEDVEKFIKTLLAFEDSYQFDSRGTYVRREMEDLLEIRKAQEAKATAERLKKETAERFATTVRGNFRLQAELTGEGDVICQVPGGNRIYTVKVISEQFLPPNGMDLSEK
jgi:uncharacterized protein YqgV (UPF0045/DUF77 family)